jgi:hypothetical protein
MTTSKHKVCKDGAGNIKKCFRMFTNTRKQLIRTCYLEQNYKYLKKPSPGMLRHVAIIRTDVSEEHIASIIRVTRIDELRTMLAVTSCRRMLTYSCYPDDEGATFP